MTNQDRKKYLDKKTGPDLRREIFVITLKKTVINNY